MEDFSFTKGKLIRYSSIIRGSLEECGELDILDRDLDDTLVTHSDNSTVNESSTTNQKYSTAADHIIERKLFSPRVSGCQWQANKQKSLEFETLKLIQQEKPEDHLRRFTRSAKMTNSSDNEPPSPASMNGSESPEQFAGFGSKPAKQKRLLSLPLIEMIVAEEHNQSFE
ncbi:unnamed protein product [Kluyveromyces dobzhanskii CBS 2104]|uniref:WGS project CCBQ000000000 data, contig 00058 n=1 Tax=Kluyveromyces dobzhanskii CBS 2104 TaxID=1427455 RepID=A0A0A8LDI2_9SACH|nr:unnamed protein product [Kluyveromyces dobzhanskii CBS 2104]